MSTELNSAGALSLPVSADVPAPARAKVVELTGGLKAAVHAVGWSVAVLGVLGFANSFTRVKAAAAPSFGHMAATLPIGVDLGILIFSALDIVLAVLDMRVVWLRLVPWTLTAATIYLNVADEPDHPTLTSFDRLAHGVLPCLWVLAVEVGAHVVRKRAGLTSATRMDKVRLSRWVLAPLSTAGLWRRMVLWEERSYPAALDRERARLLAKTDMQDTYGRLWRWRAPRRERALYRLGELAPTAARPDANPDTGADTTADTASGARRDGADTGADTTPDIKRTRPRTPGRTWGADTRAKVARLVAKHPELSAAEIAARVGVTDRTVRRHLERANGHDPVAAAS